MQSAAVLKIINIDPWLAPYIKDINARHDNYIAAHARLAGKSGRLTDNSNGHLYYGFHRTDTGWVYREKAPAARALHLIGDFNGWDRSSHPLTRIKDGDWEIRLDGDQSLKDGQRVLAQVTGDTGVFDRIPAYMTAVTQDKHTHQFTGLIRAGEHYKWQHESPPKKNPDPMYIYECHVGMAQEDPGIGKYCEFAENVLPRIKKAGYNVIQLMGIMHHSYYASFGYHVTNFFAPSAWFGTGDELKALIDAAHGMGMRVLMDLVHSHASSNTREGIADFDGSGNLYCRGEHPAWGSSLLDYSKRDTICFLLSNIKYWMEEYHFDGFRFDGVTSMLYLDHALGRAFTSYDDYFSANINHDAVAYLQLASELMREMNPRAIAIAEDVSGMPGMCLKIKHGGLGFNYRLNMGVPDFWIKTLKERKDEDWDMWAMWHELTTRRSKEKTVGYAESHDQALVGDKTLIFWLMDAEMYIGMNKAYDTPSSFRAIALIKLIRLITWALAGDAYLNFMGNEFGHPEWIDFPREGNGWSYHYARRQWSLRDNGFLKYEWLADFDRAMLDLGRGCRGFLKQPARSLWIDQSKKTIAFEKGGMIFAFNFHPLDSYDGFVIPGAAPGVYSVIFDTDRLEFGGADRISREAACDAHGGELAIYVPSRSAAAYKLMP
jgi:1,4-alpha-glucan branching enzyme